MLNILQGCYEQTLENARKGLADSQTVAGKVRDSMTGAREDYLARDRQVYATFERAFGAETDLPPYVAPGGGDSSLGGPSGAPAAGPGRDQQPGLRLSHPRDEGRTHA